MARIEPTASLTKARRMIAAIDKRINRVRKQRPAIADRLCPHACQRAWDQVPGLQGMERALFRRRGDWQAICAEHERRQASAQERRKQREFVAAERAKHRERCACCGRAHEAA